jgi:hypothetical protein
MGLPAFGEPAMSSRPLATCLALAVSLFLWTGSARASDDEKALKTKVLSSYPAALSVLEARFAKAFGTVTLSEEVWVGKPKHIRLGGQYTFAVNGSGLAKVTRTAALTTVNDAQTRAPKATVFCCNRENSFWLVREAGKPEFAIRSIAKGGEDQAFIKAQMHPWLYNYLHAPFTLGGLSARTVIADGGTAIKRVSKVRRDGKADLKVEFDLSKAANKRLRSTKGWVIVAPEEEWVIQEYEVTYATGIARGRVDYAAPNNGFPVPKRVTSSESAIGAGQPTHDEIHEFNELHFGEVPESEFQLRAFGLTEMSQAETKSGKK